MTGRDNTVRAVRAEPALLGIYLNDHLAGATGGVELLRRAAGAYRGSPRGATLRRLVTEVETDRAALRDMMAALGIPVRHYKSVLAWLVEKAGRVKLNGRLLRRSPLSSVVELEAARLAVQGKAAGWRTLRTLADSDGRLDPARLNELLTRARRQADTLEELQTRAVAEVLGLP